MIPTQVSANTAKAGQCARIVRGSTVRPGRPAAAGVSDPEGADEVAWKATACTAAYVVAYPGRPACGADTSRRRPTATADRREDVNGKLALGRCASSHPPSRSSGGRPHGASRAPGFSDTAAARRTRE